MYQSLFSNPDFWAFLLSVDRDLANAFRQSSCSCGGSLHVANYPRKPRGTAKLPDGYRVRFSFCCARDGCRKRSTPPSVRFLGRKVYLGAVVVLVSAMRQGDSPCRVRELTNRFGVDRCTIARWRVFWSELFPQTKFWDLARARLVPVFEIVAFPRSLLDAFVRTDGTKNDDHDGWLNLLRFLSPTTITRGLEIKLSGGAPRSAEDDPRRF